MSTKILTATVLGLLIFFTACEEDEQSQKAQISLGFKAAQSTNMLKSVDTLVFDSVMVGISEIEIESEQEADDDGDDMEYEFEGPYQLDLLAGTKLSEVVVIEPGIYTELEAKMEPVLDNGYSIYIEAQYTDMQGITHPLVYYTDNDIDFEVENEEGIQVNDQEIKDLIVRIDLNGLFSNIDLSNAEMGGSGTILINEDNNEELADRIEEYLEEHAEFEEDDDNDDNDNDDEDDEDDEGEDE